MASSARRRRKSITARLSEKAWSAPCRPSRRARRSPQPCWASSAPGRAAPSNPSRSRKSWDCPCAMTSNTMKPSSGPISADPGRPISPRILCISLGSIGRRHLRNTRALLPQARIAVWRQRAGAGAALPEGADAVVTSLQQALAFMPDAVLVSSPASEHVANARPFVQRNLPIFLEKPLAARSADLGDFPALCRASSGFTMVGYVLRFLPALHAIRQALRDGLLGQVHTARAEVGQSLPDWRPGSDYRQGVSSQQRLGGGALLELSHEIDYATWLFGWPQSLQCSRARLSPLEIDVEDSAHVW